jgi:hypothetical protein
LFAIQLGNTPPVQILRYEGGEAVSPTVISGTLPTGNSTLPNKYPGPVHYRDIVFDYQPVAGAGINTVLSDALAGNSQPISGAILSMDAVKKELSRLSFENALVRSVEFPDMDLALPKSIPVIRVTLAVPVTMLGVGSGQIVSYSASAPGPLKSNFRLLIQGLDATAQKAVRIEPLKFTVLLAPQLTSGAGTGQAVLSPGARDYGNLVLLLPETEAGPFTAWHQQVLAQSSGSSMEKTGELQWLSADKTKALVLLQFQGLGVVSVVRLPSKPGYVAVEMYCEKIVPQVF